MEMAQASNLLPKLGFFLQTHELKLESGRFLKKLCRESPKNGNFTIKRNVFGVLKLRN